MKLTKPWQRLNSKRYKLDANEQLMGATGAFGVAEEIKKRSRIDGEEHGKKEEEAWKNNGMDRQRKT